MKKSPRNYYFEINQGPSNRNSCDFDSYDSYKQIKKEFEKLKNTLNQLSIYQEEYSNRQHYLKWKTPTTARNLELAGINYDTTLGFRDQIGFRCGFCTDYPFLRFGKKPSNEFNY